MKRTLSNNNEEEIAVKITKGKGFIRSVHNVEEFSEDECEVKRGENILK